VILIAALLQGLFFHERLDAEAAGFAAKVPAQGVGARKTTTAAPLVTVLELTTADKLLLTTVESFMSLTVVLACESFATVTTDERTFIRVSA
jgi:hypothetical protein